MTITISEVDAIIALAQKHRIINDPLTSIANHIVQIPAISKRLQELQSIEDEENARNKKL